MDYVLYYFKDRDVQILLVIKVFVKATNHFVGRFFGHQYQLNYCVFCNQTSCI